MVLFEKKTLVLQLKLAVTKKKIMCNLSGRSRTSLGVPNITHTPSKVKMVDITYSKFVFDSYISFLVLNKVPHYVQMTVSCS